jgi:hypothetical protein
MGKTFYIEDKSKRSFEKDSIRIQSYRSNHFFQILWDSNSIGKGTTRFVNVLVFRIESNENGEVHREFLDIVSD